MSWRVAFAFGRIARNRFGRSNERTKIARRANKQLRRDFGAGRGVRGRGHGDRLDAVERLDDLAQAQVFRPEIVAPLRDAMRLVDREKIDRGLLQIGDHYPSRSSRSGAI